MVVAVHRNEGILRTMVFRKSTHQKYKAHHPKSSKESAAAILLKRMDHITLVEHAKSEEKRRRKDLALNDYPDSTIRKAKRKLKLSTPNAQEKRKLDTTKEPKAALTCSQ